MTDLIPLAKLRDAFPDGLERLYRVEVEVWEPPPAASASAAPGRGQAPKGLARYAQEADPTTTPGNCDCGLGAYGRHAEWCSFHEPAELVETSKGEWKRAFIIAESEDRSIDDIADEVMSFIGEDKAKWRVRIFYWKGGMHHDYYHVDRKRGDTVEETQCIEIDTRD